MLPIQGPALLVVAALALPQNPTPTLVTVAPSAGRQAAGAPTGIAAAKLWDQAGGMLEASSTPTLGMLYPLSDKLFVDPATGNVGVGTTLPGARLAVVGSVAIGLNAQVSESSSSVLGGQDNATLAVTHSTIAGGSGNTIGGAGTGGYSFIGGGFGNSIVGPNFSEDSTIAGGRDNLITSWGGSIGGGQLNVVDGAHGCVPGGYGNRAGISSLAAGSYCAATSRSTALGDLCTANNRSFAAGSQARALHTGGFVWADYSTGPAGSDFSTTADHQFLIRAVGGVGIGTNTPSAALDVAGQIRSTGPTGGALLAFNPLNVGASASLSWLNDVARLRIGGSGAGAQNGFDIQTVGNSSLLRITGSGNAIAKGQMHATAFVQTSDARLKTDVRELEGALDAVRALRGVRFRWDREQRPDAEAGERVGFLAQEVREVVPEAVRELPDGMLAVSYAELVPVLVEALQEQQAEIADLGAKVAAQQNEIRSLRELEARVLALETSSRDSQ